MSLPVLQEKILGEAKAQAADIARQGDLELAKERELAMQELREMEERIIVDAENQAQHASRIIHQKAELSGRASVLEAKQEEIAAAKDAFLAMLRELPEAEKKKFLASLKNLLPKTEGEVKEHTDGGFVFHGKGIEVNLTFPQLADRLFWKYRAEISRALFG